MFIGIHWFMNIIYTSMNIIYILSNINTFCVFYKVFSYNNLLFSLLDYILYHIILSYLILSYLILSSLLSFLFIYDYMYYLFVIAYYRSYTNCAMLYIPRPIWYVLAIMASLDMITTFLFLIALTFLRAGSL